MSFTCRSCGAHTEWAQFEESGKRALFDIDEMIAGAGEVRWVLEPGGLGGETWARRARPEERGVTCHFATCPDADEWRR